MPKRAAVVIHGIGQQQPYQTARGLADGLRKMAQQARTDVASVVAQVIPAMLPGRVARRTGQEAAPEPAPPSAPAVPPGRVYRVTSGEAIVDVYEAYWAPLTTGLTSFLGIVWWLLVNTFVPSRLVRLPGRKTLYDVTFASVFLFTAAVVYYFLFGALLLTTHEVLDVLGKATPPLLADRPSFDPRSGADTAVRSFGHLLTLSWNAPWTIELGAAGLGSLSRALSPVTLGWLLLTVLGIYCLFQFLFRIVELIGDLLDPRERAGLLGAPARLIGHLAIAAAFGYAYVVAESGVTPTFFAYGTIYVVFQLAYLGLKKYFVDYIGDIEVYVTRDSKSSRFAAREAVRERAIGAIKAALTSTERYDEVVVLGHSLGSVIGLDAIRELRREAGRTALAPEHYDRLVSFVTFGSPLEKTRFFFQRTSPDDPGQWTEFLAEIQQIFKQDGETRRIYWTNFWYFADVVANSLDTYNGEGMPNLVQSYNLPKPRTKHWYNLFWVHSEYVADERFLGPVYRRLIEGRPQGPPGAAAITVQ